MEYRIIASDLDGTLFNDKKEVSRENLEAIAKMAELGVYFVPCSGRTLREIPENVKGIESVRYLIHSDGAVIYDKATGKRIEKCMSKEKARPALDVLFDYGDSMTVRYKGESYVDANAHNAENYTYHRVMPFYQKMIFEVCRPMWDYKRFCYGLDGIEMICIHFHSGDDLEECKSRLEKIDGISVTRLEEQSIEVYDTEAGKGNAVLRLAEYLGYQKEATIGVGDSGNDIDMLTKAGLGLVTSNGLDIAKAAGDAVICSNEEHIAKYILENYIVK